MIMNKRELDLLENVLAKEIECALNDGIGIFQTKSKLAQKLCDEGYLEKVKHVIGGGWPVTIEGYRLTLLGNFTYCTSARCEEEP